VGEEPDAGFEVFGVGGVLGELVLFCSNIWGAGLLRNLLVLGLVGGCQLGMTFGVEDESFVVVRILKVGFY